MSQTLQDKMFAEMKSKNLFSKANKFAMNYVDEAFDRHIYPTTEALQNLSKFDVPLPAETGDAEQVLDFLNEFGTPATVSQIGGRYFGFVNGSVVPAALAAKSLSIFWDQNTAMQVISPLCATLETVVEKWLVSLFGLPEHTVVGFVSGTSMANFCGLAAARYRLLKNQGWDVTEQGLFGAPPVRVIAGREAHSTILKAISLTGFGKANIEWVDTDEQGRMVAENVPELDSRCLVILQAGNVNSGSFDPFLAVCKKAQEAGAWVHIDGAFGLWAGATSDLRHLTEGFQLAQSWAADAHKTLNTPYDSGLILCVDKDALTSSLHMTGGYIVVGDKRDGMYYTPEMSRRARVVELWAALSYLGKQGVNELVVGLCEKAKQFAREVSQLEGFEVLNDVVFNQVVVACKSDELTEKTIAQIQELRECWVGGSVWKGRKVIRVSVCSWATTAADISRSVRSFEKAYQLVTSSMN